MMLEVVLTFKQSNNVLAYAINRYIDTYKQ